MLFELKPTDSHKSFYGKCYCLMQDSEIVLYSYNVKIMVYSTIDKTLRRCWFGFSATTQRHINSFLQYVNRPEMQGKANFISMDYGKTY